jgi:uncharacterized membrane-anchored protein YitT (DUF2179 family)
MNGTWQRTLMRFALLNVAGVISAVSVLMFLIPAQVAPSGVTGIATVLNHYFQTPIGLFVILGNIPIQIYAFFVLGRRWRPLAATIYVIVSSSLMLDWISQTPMLAELLKPISQDRLLNTIFGSILDGISVALVYIAGATFGGTSTISRIMQIKLGLPQSTSALYSNLFTVALSGFVFGWESALYSLLMLFIAGIATDYAMEGPSIIRTALIVTDNPHEVANTILERMGRGVTGWDGQGMYTQKPHTVLFVTISRPQVTELRWLVHKTDPKAFIVIGQGHTAFGEGFQRSEGALQLEDSF